MIQHLVLTELDRLALRRRVLHMLKLMALVWLMAAVVCAGLWLFDIRFQASAVTIVTLIGGIALALAAIGCTIAWNSARNYLTLARSVEAAFPELKSSLITAIEQKPESSGGEFGYLQASVIRQAFDHANRHNWEELVSERKLLLGVVINVAFFALFATALFGAVRNIANTPKGSPLAALLPSAKPFSMTVEPGNVEVEKGTSLLVLARIQGRMPDVGTLQYRADSDDPTSVRMPASLKDPLLSARIPVVDHPLEYSVTIDQQTSPAYRVTVFEYPTLERADAILVYPAFTGLKEKTIEDVRTVSAVVGTQLTLRCKLNKPVQTAVLSNVKTDAAEGTIELKPKVDDPLVYQMTITLAESRRLKLELVDEAGRKNKKNEQFIINVLPNQPAAVKPVYPARDLEVSPLEEVDVKASVADDFGVLRAGVAYSFAGKPLETVELSAVLNGKEKHELTYQFAMETLGAEVDQLLSYYWWVEDFDNEGKPRRTESDMYFAEVRPFEEIFRQGEQPGGEQTQRERQNRQQGGQNEQDAQNVATAQKDIINATWKVIRREVSEKLSPGFAEDVEQIRKAQAGAAERAAALEERLQDDKSQEHLADALHQMATAVEQLNSAVETPAREPLTTALAAEQAAYQSMLKLRAREHEVVRQQQRGQQNPRQNSARSQQQREQLDQLDLRQDENRYETQRSAEEQQQESTQERENRQVLNRLRELARRQHDLNDRLKELQSALEEAKTPKEQEEIRRQLRRLQEEQQQILQDTDELQSRLDQPESQDRLADERQQLEQTREQVRRASAALQQERVGQASAAGAKAEQQFEDLREEFRRRASNRFSTEMQQMRDAARQLETNQQKVAEQLREKPQPKEQTPSLTDSADPDDALTKQLADQREQLGQLQDRMRDTIERAETTEPLLSERLYETARTAREQNLDRLLQITDRLVRQGMRQEAQRSEAMTSDGVRQLREGIEKAAEGVLGDETEALRRARQELEQLSRELEQEVQQNSRAQAGNPQQRPGDPNNRSQQPGAGDNSQQPGDRNRESQQPGGQPGNDAQNEQQPVDGKGNAGKGRPRGGQRQGADERQGAGQRGGQPGDQRQAVEPQRQNQLDEPNSSDPQIDNQPPQGVGQNGSQAGRGQGNRQQRQAAQNGGRQAPAQRGGPRGGDNLNIGGAASEESIAGPLTGDRFREWSDRLRDVEEMVNDPQLRAEAARIRERARAIRTETQRHSTAPEWDLVRDQLLTPLTELDKRVGEELLRRTSKKALVPLDRDPVPPEYAEKTNRYYEQLGSGK